MAISGPIAPYSNPPIQPQFYKPSRFQISDIQIGATTTVTATATMNYVIGQLVRFLIPEGYGCQQLNGLSGLVINLPSSNMVEVSINSSFFDPFISANLSQVPNITAIGDVNSGTVYLGNNVLQYIPGSFQNISPT
jgi:hypothetical protein